MDRENALKLALFIALGISSAVFIFWWVRRAREQRAGKQPPEESSLSGGSMPSRLAIGFVTNFFDTLGIGSFATTTAAFRLLRMMRDEYIPGTLNIGHTLPIVAQAFIFMAVIEVDAGMLVWSIISAVIGAWLGAGIVSGLSRRLIQLGMGGALLLTALFMLLSQYGLLPTTGAASGVSTTQLLIVIAANFALGVVGPLGIGSYAPTLALFSVLGMDLRAAFPLMMGVGAFSMIAAGVKFLDTRSYDRRAALGLTLGGVPAVLLAAFVVKSLPLDTLRWLVAVVIVYTAVMMMRAAYAEREHSSLPFAAEEKLQ